ncbi:DgyrCDS9157 [Dimorphilus gyrociliatus]|uniref:GDP-fucose protein O-fucosyltransferase 2 n=1 Tax=Dimorphilus gyrociliatus TaxID=2664684 RepID=A0A7I8VYK2_9ANNE|nr:DgyrCDS9157 [Dimorphilus gyrociliatus]
MILSLSIFILIFNSISLLNANEESDTRYLLYDINPGEGFNLRRDVYIRMANMIKFLNEKEKWVLVLPPWGRLYHWQTSGIKSSRIPWKTFFDVQSLKDSKPKIEQIYYLQRYKEGWSGGRWEEKIDVRDCLDPTGFEKIDGKWKWSFFGYSEKIYGEKFDCLSVQAEIATMKKFLLNEKARSIFLLHAEELIHGRFSEWSREWWTARRSMRFSKELVNTANSFRKEKLQSTDDSDKTIQDPDWTKQVKKPGEAIGGPYVAVHLRRRDFLYGHKDDVPSIQWAAHQLRKILVDKDLMKLFVATDAPDNEYRELVESLPDFEVYRYIPTQEELEKFTDGGIAIIDQLICVHARFFIGTNLSTFSFRIHEERQILGFDAKTTYNVVCGTGKDVCEQPSIWPVMY